MTLLFNSEEYLNKRGDRLNRLGVEVLALNRFLTKYLDSEQPYPLGDEFIQAVEADIDPAVFPYYTPAQPDFEEMEKPGAKMLPDYNDLVLIAKAVEDADIGMAGVCGLSRQKTVGTSDLIDMAIFCFAFGRQFKLFGFLAGLYDNYLPHLDQLTTTIKPVKGSDKIEVTTGHQLDQEDGKFLADMGAVFNELNESADRAISLVNQKLGYWERWIADIMGHKSQTSGATKGKVTKKQKRKEQACKIFLRLEIKPNMFKSEIARLIQNRWVLSKEDKVPSKRCIIDYLKEAALI